MPAEVTPEQVEPHFRETWLRFFSAALTGASALENESISSVVDLSVQTAELALEQYKKRWWDK